MLWGSGGELVGLPRLVLYIYSLWILDLGICGECHFVRWQRRQTRSVSVHKKDEMLHFFLKLLGKAVLKLFGDFRMDLL